MKIPILSGIYGKAIDLGIAYPVNMVPVVLPNGVNEGYLRPADGIVGSSQAGITGADRGAIAWDGVCYRVVGTHFCRQSSKGKLDVLGTIPGTGRVSMDYGYSGIIGKNYTALLAIVADGRLFYFSNVTEQITEVTDVDLGTPLDVVWSNGYFVMTDGTYVFNTSLTNPYSIAQGDYGTTDVDPDPIVGLIKFQNEVYVLNRHTIQVMVNTGQPVVGTFTFSVVDGGQITKGCVGTHACCVFESNIAFLGSGRNEAPGVYVGANAQSQKISSVEIDRLLATYTEAELASVILEARNDNAHKHLYVHLPDRTLLFDAEASRAFGQLVWVTLTSSTTGFSRYRAQSMVWCYGQWNVGDPLSGRVGVFSSSTSTHWGETVRWEFSTPIAYNEGAGALFHELELVSLPGSTTKGTAPTVYTSYSSDGVTWSPSRGVRVAGKRLAWLQQGRMEQTRMQRFEGTSDVHMPVVRLEARLEPLAY